MKNQSNAKETTISGRLIDLYFSSGFAFGFWFVTIMCIFISIVNKSVVKYNEYLALFTVFGLASFADTLRISGKLKEYKLSRIETENSLFIIDGINKGKCIISEYHVKKPFELNVRLIKITSESSEHYCIEKFKLKYFFSAGLLYWFGKNNLTTGST